MCGISAIIINNNIKNNVINFRQEILKMNNLISHRGPDDEGYFELVHKTNKTRFYFGDITPQDVIKNESKDKIFKHITDKDINENSSVLLGHRRLSIIDLSISAHQPLNDINDNYTIVFNGEIYNFSELKTELISSGAKFKSDSDTEVILKMYETYGFKSFNKLKGMWSFIIFDKKKNEVICCRDRFGIKPLYYYFDKFRNLYFASEIKQFFLLKQWNASLNVDRAYDYIMFAQTDHTNETLFKNVFQCPAGHYFRYKLQNKESSFNKLEFKKWYYLEKNLKKNKSFEQDEEKLRQLIEKSNQQHNIADVPISYTLSGGIDSTILVGERSNNYPKQTLSTFSIFSEDKKIDEKKWVNEIINNSNNIVNFSNIPKLQNFLDELEKIIWTLDEPPCDSTIYSEWSVYKMISSRNYKVTISGQGADEIFGGYHNYFFSYLLFLLSRFKFILFFKELSKFNSIHKYQKAYIYRGLLSKLIPEFVFKIKNKFIKNSNPLFSLKKTKFYKLDKNFQREKLVGIKNLSVFQIKSSMLPKLLRYADRLSMKHSLEVRVPYLDHDLVEFSLAIPDNKKIKNGITKYILRESCKEFLPNQIYKRLDKIGFEVASKKWITNKEQNIKLKKYTENLLDNSKNIFNENTINLIRQTMKKEIEFNDIVFRFIFFSIWMKIFKIKVN